MLKFLIFYFLFWKYVYRNTLSFLRNYLNNNLQVPTWLLWLPRCLFHTLCCIMLPQNNDPSLKTGVMCERSLIWYFVLNSCEHHFAVEQTFEALSRAFIRLICSSFCFSRWTTCQIPTSLVRLILRENFGKIKYEKVDYNLVCPLKMSNWKHVHEMPKSE